MNRLSNFFFSNGEILDLRNLTSTSKKKRFSNHKVLINKVDVLCFNFLSPFCLFPYFGFLLADACPCLSLNY